jgi:hypothetical protein
MPAQVVPTTSSSTATPAWLRWFLGVVVASLVVAGLLWYAFAREGSMSVSETIAACSQLLDGSDSPTTTALVPTVIGLGSRTSVGVFDTSRGWQWCFVGTGTAPISKAVLRAPVGVAGAVTDGGLSGDVLMVVHRNSPTTNVEVDTASSRSAVIARGGGFEVLRIAMTTWPKRHLGTRDRVVLGRIMGFNAAGRVTSSQPFAWCLGSINVDSGGNC